MQDDYFEDNIDWESVFKEISKIPASFIKFHNMLQKYKETSENFITCTTIAKMNKIYFVNDKKYLRLHSDFFSRDIVDAWETPCHVDFSVETIEMVRYQKKTHSFQVLKWEDFQLLFTSCPVMRYEIKVPPLRNHRTKIPCVWAKPKYWRKQVLFAHW